MWIDLKKVIKYLPWVQKTPGLITLHSVSHGTLEMWKIQTLARAFLVHSAVKVFAAASSDTKTKDEEPAAIISKLQSTLTVHIQSTGTEVTKRSITVLSVICALGLNNATKVDNKFATLPKAISCNLRWLFTCRVRTQKSQRNLLLFCL